MSPAAPGRRLGLPWSLATQFVESDWAVVALRAGAYFAFALMVWRDKSGQAQMFLGVSHDAAQRAALPATVR